jgi:hypothetical protein
VRGSASSAARQEMFELFVLDRNSKTNKSALLELFQFYGIHSGAIFFDNVTSGQPHLPEFRCFVHLPSIKGTSFQGQVNTIAIKKFSPAHLRVSPPLVVCHAYFVNIQVRIPSHTKMRAIYVLLNNVCQNRRIAII